MLIQIAQTDNFSWISLLIPALSSLVAAGLGAWVSYLFLIRQNDIYKKNQNEIAIDIIISKMESLESKLSLYNKRLIIDDWDAGYSPKSMEYFFLNYCNLTTIITNDYRIEKDIYGSLYKLNIQTLMSYILSYNDCIDRGNIVFHNRSNYLYNNESTIKKACSTWISGNDNIVNNTIAHNIACKDMVKEIEKAISEFKEIINTKVKGNNNEQKSF